MLILQSLLLGLAYMLAPGPVLIETVRRSISGGLRSAAAVQCGAITANLMYAILFIGGIERVLRSSSLKFGLGMLGAALLVYLGVSMALDGRRIAERIGAGRHAPGMRQERIWRPFTVGLLLLLINPYSLVFWFSVGNVAFGTSLESLGGFLLGGTLGCAIAALVAGRLGMARMRHHATWIWGGCAAVLLALGAQLGYATLVAGAGL